MDSSKISIIPTIGSWWLDTGTADVPDSIDRKARSDLPLRRVVKVISSDTVSGSRFVTIAGHWQQRLPDGRWETVATRRTYADIASFGANRKYQPLSKIGLIRD